MICSNLLRKTWYCDRSIFNSVFSSIININETGKNKYPNMFWNMKTIRKIAFTNIDYVLQDSFFIISNRSSEYMSGESKLYEGNHNHLHDMRNLCSIPGAFLQFNSFSFYCNWNNLLLPNTFLNPTYWNISGFIRILKKT